MYNSYEITMNLQRNCILLLEGTDEDDHEGDLEKWRFYKDDFTSDFHQARDTRTHT